MLVLRDLLQFGQAITLSKRFSYGTDFVAHGGQFLEMAQVLREQLSTSSQPKAILHATLDFRVDAQISEVSR